MPKKGCKSEVKGFLDVKLNDFANARLPSGGCGRVSKSAIMVSKAKSARETKQWWECEEEDFEDLDLEAEQPQSEDTEDLALLENTRPEKVQGSTRRHRKKGGRGEKSPEIGGISGFDYPQDLWFILADYIPPEDVGRFAGICKSTANTVASPAFWKRLYKRHLIPSKELPIQLKPEMTTSRLYALRTKVVLSLFYTYSPFVERIKPSSGLQLCPESLRKLSKGVCRAVWHEQHQERSKKLWHYYFKFESSDVPFRVAPKTKVTTRLEYLDNIWTNHEEGSCLLKVASTQFMPPRPEIVLGCRLVEVSVPLSADLHSYKLKLAFQPPSGQLNGNPSLLVLDSLLSLCVLDWWHPQFPLPLMLQ